MTAAAASARADARRPRAGLRVLSGFFGLLALADVVQLVQAARGEHPDPPGLLAVHLLTGGLAAWAAAALWRSAPAALAAVLAWGSATAGMLAILGPAIDEPREAWRGLWIAAGVVLLGTTAVAAYIRSRVRSPAPERAG